MGKPADPMGGLVLRNDGYISAGCIEGLPKTNTAYECQDGFCFGAGSWDNGLLGEFPPTDRLAGVAG